MAELDKYLKVAGVRIDDPDVIAVLRAVEHLDGCGRCRVLAVAAKLVEWDRVGHRPSLRRVQGMNVKGAHNISRLRAKRSGNAGASTAHGKALSSRTSSRVAGGCRAA